MDISTIQQAIESIKTLNLNLNATTTDKLADIVMPIYKMSIIKTYVGWAMWFLVFLIIVIGIIWFFSKVIKEENKNN